MPLANQHSVQRWPITSSRTIFTATICLLLCTAHSAGMGSNRTVHDSADNHISLEQYIRDAHQKFAGRTDDDVLALLIHFDNFNCLPCLNDFMEFCDSLRAGNILRSHTSALLIISRNEQSLQQQTVSMKRWAKENGITFPLVCVPRPFFDEWKIERTTVLLLKNGASIEFSQTIPIPHKLQSEIFARLRKGSHR
jgi:hypothetical protein